MSKFTSKVRDWMWRFKSSRKAQVIALVSLLVIIGVVIGVVLALRSKKPNFLTTVNGVQTSGFTTDSSSPRRLLDGVIVDSQAEATAIPVSVMIENLSTVRPQKGLSSASVVYEALAEGGITRFMAVYAGAGTLSAIGPVRSAREYYVDWADEYGGIYAHVGGSPQALGKLSQDSKIVDLNQIGGDQIYFWRDLDIAAPHNLLTSGEKMAFAVRDFLGETPVASFQPWTFKDDANKEDRPTGEHHVQIDFSSESYAVDWKYERKTNTYVRSNGGEAQVDQLNNQPLVAHTLVVQFISTSLIDQATGRLAMKTIGSGRAVVFVDGQRIDGTWLKADDNSRTQFTDAQGQLIPFNAGSIWVEVVPDDRDITAS